MSTTDSSLTAVLARARDDRRRRLAGSLDAVALTRSNATSASRAIATQAEQLSAELRSRTPETTPVDRGGWGPRPSSNDGGILRAVHDAPLSSAPPTEPGGDGEDDAEDGQDRSWLR